MISVIIPTYKPGLYLRDCLLSLSNQSLPYSEYELILVLNGPSTPYRSQLEESLSSLNSDLNSKIEYTSTPGVSNARNIGINSSRGEYIVFIDDDDLVSCDYLSSLLSLADESRLVIANMLDFVESPLETSEGYIAKAFNCNKLRNRIGLIHGSSFFSSSCGKLIPRKIIGNKRFDTSFRLGEDSLFMASLSNKVQNITLTSHVTTYYRRVRPQSASRSHYSFKDRLNSVLHQEWAYTKMYFKGFPSYNLWFFLNRLAAVALRFK